jgi:hypothetical protein
MDSIQEILVYLILFLAVFYLGYLAFGKKSAKGCSACPANGNI